MEICIKTFPDLTKDELYDILKLRNAVFILEQNCPYQDIDDLDRQAIHIFFREDGRITAYSRLLDKGILADEVVLGRVISVNRRQGIGTKLVTVSIETAKEMLKAGSVLIEAQNYARKLYDNLGFNATSDVFLLDGIPHIKMRLVLD